jgi:hypothetical protein
MARQHLSVAGSLARKLLRFQCNQQHWELDMSALVVALYDNHTAAERVRTRLVREGFPTDRVQLTSSEEPGQAALVGAGDDLETQLEEYFSGLFDRVDEIPNVHFFVDGVQQGHAALTVHPRGEVETNRALEIMEEARPLEICDHDLLDQGMEYAASGTRDDESFIRQLLDASADAARRRTRH